MNENNGHLDSIAQALHRLSIPLGWVRTTIDDLGEVRLGRQRSPKNRSKDHPTKYLRAANITWNGIDLNDVLDMEFKPKELETYRLNTGDVLLSEASGSAAEVGKPAIWTGEIGDCCFQNTVIRFRPSEAVQPRYAYLAFLHFARNRVFSQVAKGVGIHHLSADRFSAIPFLLPPVAEQERIVVRADELLTELDAGVAALKRVRANLKRYRASALKAAVEGKLTEQWRTDHVPPETGQQLLDRILKERRQRWEAEQLAAYEAKGKQPPEDWKDRYKEPQAPDTTDLPTLPEGWCWASIDQLVHVGTGTTPKRSNPDFYKGGTIPWVLSSAVNERIVTEAKEFITEKAIKETNLTIYPIGTLIVALYGEGQTRGKVSELDIEATVNQAIGALVFDVATSADCREFVKLYLESRYIELRMKAAGGMQPNLNLGLLRQVAIPLPPIEEQAEVWKQVEVAAASVTQVEIEVQRGLIRAARLRQSILKDAFEGRLVAQDPADEPASELLARIKTARQPVVQKPASTISPRRVPKEITLRRAAVVAYMISRIGPNGSTAKADSLGRTKLVKALYIAQTHEGLDLRFRFQRYAAGPFDEALFKLEGTAKKNDWFITKERDNFGVTYHAAPQTETMRRQATKFLTDKQASFERLLGHFDTMDMKQAELFATAYAAWNDLLIDGREITDDSIIEEFYSWDEKKKEFSRAVILKQLKWMRAEGYVPSGKGERTQHRDRKTKLPSKQRKAT